MKATIAALTLLAGLAAPAAAQYGAPAPQPRPEVPRNQPTQAAQPAITSSSDVRGGVACLAGRDAAAFSRLLATPPYSAAERREAVRLLPLIQRCTRSESALTTSGTALRGAAAEDLYERQFASAPAARTPALAPAPFLRPNEARAPAEIAPLAPTYALAECTSAQRQELVRAYLATDPSSEAEQAAFRALQPGLIACAPPGSSRQLGVDGPTLRGILAETLYRWSAVQRDGPSSPFAAAPAAAQ